MKLLGSTEQACPNCGIVLNRLPQKKTKCRDCGRYIYVRTRPQDRQRVLLPEAELSELDQQWVIDHENTPHISPRPVEVMERANNELSSQFGRPPGYGDVMWRIFNEELLRFSSTESWGLYAQVNFEMGELLMSQGKHKGSLEQYVIAFILFVNGPRNIDKELVRSGYARFSGDAPCPQLQAKRIGQMLTSVGSTVEDIKERFSTLAWFWRIDLPQSIGCKK